MPEPLIIKHRPENRWVAQHLTSGLYLGEVDPNDVATVLENYARGMRSGSKDCPVYPPEVLYNGKPARFIRSNIPKLDPVPATQGVGT